MSKPCKHETTVDSCHICKLAATNPQYAERWNKKPSITIPLEICDHRGHESSQPGSLKTWYKCEHPDKPLGELVCPCMGCGPKCRGYEIDGQRPKATVTIENGACGIGDAVLGLLAIGGYKKENPNTAVTYNIGGGAIQWARLFDVDVNYGVAKPSEGALPNAVQMNIGYSTEWVNKCKDRSRLRRYCDNIGTKFYELPKLKDNTRLWDAGAAYRDSIVLFPFSHHKAREWNNDGWVAVEKLLTSTGERVLVLDQHPHKLNDLTGQKICEQSPEQIVSILLNAKAVIGLDSGGTHIAGVLGIPTLALCGPSSGDGIFAEYLQVKSLQINTLMFLQPYQVVRELTAMIAGVTYRQPINYTI